MKKNGFSLVDHPWLFLLVFILVTLVLNLLSAVLLIVVGKLELNDPLTGLWVAILAYGLMVFLIVPLGLGMRNRLQPYTAYLAEIRLTTWKPILKLVGLGLSCYLFFALSQFGATLIYRMSVEGAINAAFLRSAFPFESEFPPYSWGFLSTFISVLEELAFRGVILAIFLRKYKPTQAVLFSAIGFGIMHLFNLISGFELIWVAGNTLWAVMLGLFYGYITYKTGSLLPAMLVHYFGNLFIYPLTAYLQITASTEVQVLYGITLTMGIVPVVLMFLWARAFTSWWPFATAAEQESLPDVVTDAHGLGGAP